MPWTCSSDAARGAQYRPSCRASRSTNDFAGCPTPGARRRGFAESSRARGRTRGTPATSRARTRRRAADHRASTPSPRRATPPSPTRPHLLSGAAPPRAARAVLKCRPAADRSGGASNECLASRRTASTRRPRASRARVVAVGRRQPMAWRRRLPIVVSVRGRFDARSGETLLEGGTREERI